MASPGNPTGGQMLAANGATDDKIPIVDTSVGASNAANKYLTVLEAAKLIARVRPDGSAFKTPILHADVGTTWTALNSTSTTADAQGRAIVSFNGVGARWEHKALVQSLPGGTSWTATMEVTPLRFFGLLFQLAGLIIRESSTGKFVTHHLATNRDENMYSIWSQFGSNLAASSSDNGGYTTFNAAQSASRFVRISRSGSTLDYLASPDGIVWDSLGTQTVTTRFTTEPDQVGFVVGIFDNTGATSAVCADIYVT